ncbi:MAG: Dabb family protein [Verrucomicrobiae bacterium]|nr:Dabb family protein [Verrucomicrobiae bacterium]
MLVALALAAVPMILGCGTARQVATPGRFHHIGLVWLKEPGNVEHRQRIISAAHGFAGAIPEVQSISVGQSPPSTSPYVDSSFDICLIIQFEDKAAMDRYARHPVHEKAAQETFLPLSQRLLFYDFIAE